VILSALRSCILSGAALAALSLAATAAAQTEDSAVGEVIVTAASLEETLPIELSRYGSDIEMIHGETIRNSVYIDTSQALQMQTPGLHVAPRNGPFSYVDLSLQGSRTGDVLWTVDGVRINNRLYTSTSPADTLPSSMIERIEVLKGGQSLFYGTQAAAGVINVVTRSFSNRPGGELSAGLHSNGGVHVSGYGRGAIGRHQFVAFGSKDQAEGYETYDVYQPSATMRKRSYDVVSGGLKYGYSFTDDLRLQLQYQHTDAKLAYPAPRLTALSRNVRDEDILAARLDYTPDGPAQFFLKAYHHKWDTLYTTINNDVNNPGRFIVVDQDTYWGYRDSGINALLKLRLHRGLEYNLGYDFQTYRGRDDVLLIAEQSEQVHAGILQIRTTEDMFENARFAAGVRYDKTKESSSTIWNVSGRYDVRENLYVEGVGGTSFILPSAEQLFGIDPCCAQGNPNLQPERSLNANLSMGGWMRLGQGVSWQVTGFARRIDNLISGVYDLPAFPDGIYINAPRRVNTRGAEVTMNAALTEAWRVNASYTYARTRQEGSNQQFDRTPLHYAKAGLVYAPYDRPFGGSVSANWSGALYSTVAGFGRQNHGDYVVVDLAAHAFLDGADRRHKVAARLENVFDEAYAPRIGSALVDGSTTQRFLFRNRGVPRTFHVNYSYQF